MYRKIYYSVVWIPPWPSLSWSWPWSSTRWHMPLIMLRLVRIRISLFGLLICALVCAGSFLQDKYYPVKTFLFNSSCLPGLLDESAGPRPHFLASPVDPNLDALHELLAQGPDADRVRRRWDRLQLRQLGRDQREEAAQGCQEQVLKEEEHEGENVEYDVWCYLFAFVIVIVLVAVIVVYHCYCCCFCCCCNFSWFFMLLILFVILFLLLLFVLLLWLPSLLLLLIVAAVFSVDLWCCFFVCDVVAVAALVVAALHLLNYFCFSIILKFYDIFVFCDMYNEMSHII